MHLGYPPRQRATDAPLSVDVTADTEAPPARVTPLRRLRLPRAWVGMSGYLVAGVFLGVVLIAALSIGRGGDAVSAASGPPPITDNVVRLHARDIGASCWVGYEKLGPARLTVALEVGIDGKIRYAAASGETPAMRSCVEAHVKSWVFLPQSQAQTMALPFEVDRR